MEYHFHFLDRGREGGKEGERKTEGSSVCACGWWYIEEGIPQTSFCLAELSTNEAFHSLASFLPVSKGITLEQNNIEITYLIEGLSAIRA